MGLLRSRFLAAGSAALVLGVCGLGVLVGFGYLEFWVAVQLLATGAVLAAAAAMILMVRRSNRYIRDLRRHLDHHARTVSEVAGENRAELIGRADDLVARMARLEQLSESRRAARVRAVDAEEEPVGIGSLPEDVVRSAS